MLTRFKSHRLGSSPRMRGAPLLGSFRIGFTKDFRFIPAHAGSTFPPDPLPESLAVHPRACGEHHLEVHLDLGHVGSSPRMRGALTQTLPR